eukprot:TRINITY_DN9285_c0_g1_i1.p1 TRINITY_DN9285_c0_g1~~TRINITY_DN9285_c0_g1_i1.p1  ORF type:complete len:140 (-),score=23.37 TRINITY_DN9285_c0_g1_i1:11-430(-)
MDSGSGLNVNRVLISNVASIGGSATVTGVSGRIVLADGSDAQPDVVIYLLVNATSVAGPEGEVVAWPTGTTQFPIQVNVKGTKGIFSAHAQIQGLSGVALVARKRFTNFPDQFLLEPDVAIVNRAGRLFIRGMIEVTNK